jgi:hypothetical protein
VERPDPDEELMAVCGQDQIGSGLTASLPTPNKNVMTVAPITRNFADRLSYSDTKKDAPQALRKSCAHQTEGVSKPGHICRSIGDSARSWLGVQELILCLVLQLVAIPMIHTILRSSRDKRTISPLL